MEKQEKQKFYSREEMKQGNISLILDKYDDIFSDFDPRQYSEKALSDDFLAECKRAARDKPDDGVIQLILKVPDKKRTHTDEATIMHRMKNHFEKHFREKQKEVTKMRKEGSLWLFAGAVLILLSGLLYEHEGFIYSILLVVFEPAGWFTVWTGFEKVFLDPLEKVRDFHFYRKMAKAEIVFESY